MRTGRRYVLAIGAKVGSQEPLTLSFSEALGKSLPGIEVRDAQNRSVGPTITAAGAYDTVRVAPPSGWRAGETYTLELTSQLADASGNTWDKTLDLSFSVDKSPVVDTLDFPKVRDVARLGSMLFVAADSDGLFMVDASNPADLKNHLPNNLSFPFPFNDPVRGVAVDPHGRVLAAGGGVASQGQLKYLDPLAVDLVAIAADANARLDAFKGVSIISDQLNPSVGTTLPEGTPGRVSVLSNDETSSWKVGEPGPEGLLVQVSPPDQNGEVEVTVSGTNAVGGHPVSLHDDTRGRWHRVDADATGQFSFSLTSQPGNSVRLLRNQRTIAYVLTAGVGVEVVDADAFYNDPTPEVQSDLLGIYSGYLDPELVLCGGTVAEIGTALIDLVPLFDPANLHPLTLVGLVHNKGLLLLESNVNDVGNVSFLNEQCIQVDGSSAVAGLEVAQRYAFDHDKDGKLEASEERDYAMVAHSTGLLIYDVTDRMEIQLVGRIRLPGRAAALSLDRDGRRVYISGFGGGLYVVNFDELPSLELLDGNGDGVDDRVLETVALTGNTNTPSLLVPELGLVLAGGLNRGLTAVAAGKPRVQALTRSATGEMRSVAKLAPYGVPTAPESSEPGAPSLSGSFFLQLDLPGSLGPSVDLDLASLGPGGREISGLGDSIANLPKPQKELTAWRLSDNPLHAGYNLYRTGDLAVLADVRASRSYTRTAKETEVCVRCDVPEATTEILSGDTIGVRLPEALRGSLGGVYSGEQLDRSELTLASTRWEAIPSLRQEPALNASTSGAAAPGTLLASGEMSLEAADLSLKGRSLDFVFHRTYRNQTIGNGPLGPGWDHAYNLRLRELPNGDVEYYDGRGRRELFTKEGTGLKAPKGRFVTLDRTASGWVMLDAAHNLIRFDRFGRLVSIADPVKDSADTGSELRFFYDLSSRLTRVTDTLDRHVTLEERSKVLEEVSQVEQASAASHVDQEVDVAALVGFASCHRSEHPESPSRPFPRSPHPIEPPEGAPAYSPAVRAPQARRPRESESPRHDKPRSGRQNALDWSLVTDGPRCRSAGA